MNNRLFSFIFLAAAAVFLIAAAGCSKKIEKTAPVSDVVVKSPYNELDTTTMISYNGSRKVWILESVHVVRPLADTGHIHGDPVAITVFDSLGKQSSKVLSDSGIADASMKEFTVWGNVYVLAENGTKVNAQKLAWNQKTHRVTSDTYVQLTTKKGDVLRGKGLDAAEDFSSWEFKSEVSGKFPNFKERIEKDEAFE
jgi:LPS export ABC transporter protein LptC